MSGILEDVLTAAGILALLLIALEAGFVMGRRTTTDPDARAGGQVGVVQGAILGLLGLLLAFTFGAAGGRFLERQDLIVQEANAIGTAYLRADLLDEPHKSELRAALQRYTEHRIGVSGRLRKGVDPATLAEVERLHARIWDAAIAGVTAKSSAIMGVLLPVNEVIDLHATRLAAGKKTPAAHHHGIAHDVLGIGGGCHGLRLWNGWAQARPVNGGPGDSDRRGAVDHRRPRQPARRPASAQRCAPQGADV